MKKNAGRKKKSACVSLSPVDRVWQAIFSSADTISYNERDTEAEAGTEVALSLKIRKIVK